MRCSLKRGYNKKVSIMLSDVLCLDGFVLHFTLRVQNGSEVHPASYPMGTRSFSLGVKWPEREADHSPPSSVEVMNAWSYTSTHNTSSWRGA
jgi:hypothetical protein